MFPAHLCHREDEVHGRVLRVNAFQLHAQFEAILDRGDCLGLSTHRVERTRLPSSLILASWAWGEGAPLDPICLLVSNGVTYWGSVLQGVPRGRESCRTILKGWIRARGKGSTTYLMVRSVLNCRKDTRTHKSADEGGGSLEGTSLLLPTQEVPYRILFSTLDIFILLVCQGLSRRKH